MLAQQPGRRRGRSVAFKRGGGRRGAERGGGGAERARARPRRQQRGHGRRRVHAAGAAARGGGAAVPPHGARRGLVGHGRWRSVAGRGAAVRAAAGAAPGPADHPLGALHGLVASQRAPAQEGLRLRHGQRADLPDLPVRGGPRRRRRRRPPQHRRVPHEAVRVHVPGLQVPSGPGGESRPRGQPRPGRAGGPRRGAGPCEGRGRSQAGTLRPICWGSVPLLCSANLGVPAGPSPQARGRSWGRAGGAAAPPAMRAEGCWGLGSPSPRRLLVPLEALSIPRPGCERVEASGAKQKPLKGKVPRSMWNPANFPLPKFYFYNKVKQAGSVAVSFVPVLAAAGSSTSWVYLHLLLWLWLCFSSLQ